MSFFDTKDLVIIGGAGIIVLIISNFIKKYGVPAISEAVENIDAGADQVADYYVKKQMAWQEVQEAEGIVETYQAYMRYLGF